MVMGLVVMWLGGSFGLHAGEKIAVAVVVLILFWGAFALISAATRRAPWILLPLLAMITYGWTFHAGFFNYYLSIGLSFFGVALFWKGRRWEQIVALAMAPLIYLAHPLGVTWLFCACAYIYLAEKVNRRYHAILLFIPCLSLVGLHFYLANDF